MQRRGIFLLAIAALFLALPPQSAYADHCGAGEVHAETQADLDAMRAAKFPEDYIKLGNCWPKDSKDIGKEVGQAKQELNGMWCKGHPTLACRAYRSTVEDLDGQFAVCIVDFIKKYRQRDPGLCITSAYRSTNHQQCICGGGSSGCAAPGRSNHQRGIAVDLIARNYPDMHTAVRSYPGLRHLTIANDPYHVEADSSGKCGVGVAGPNDGPAPQMSAFQSAANALRNFFSPPPPPPVASTPINPIYDPTQYFSTSTPYASSTPTSSSTPSVADPDSKPSKAVSDLIEALADPEPSKPTTVSTGTPIELINALGNVAGLKPGQKPTTTPTTTISVSTLTPKDTFTSADLRNSGNVSFQNRSATFMLLEKMKQVLLGLLAILKPFGGRQPIAPSIHYTTGVIAD